jgi:U3 small nucleolar RNA-associated protein 21
MGLVRVSDSLDDEISCLGVDSTYIYASSKKTAYAFLFGRKVVKRYVGHEADIHQIMPFAAHLISVDEDNVVKIWDIESTGT